MIKFTLASFKKQLLWKGAHHIYEPETEYVIKSLERGKFHHFGIDRGYLRTTNEGDGYETFYLTDKGWELIQKIQNNNKTIL